MLSEQEITAKLERMGYKGAELRAAMRDVAQVIFGKLAAAYLAKLPAEEAAKISSLPEEEAQAYLAEHQDSMPKLPQQEFEKIHDDTWEEYFSAMAQ